MSDRPAGTAPHNWSSAQLIRLESEWRRLQRAFAFHPQVEIIPLTGDPPGEYQVQYKLTTLAVDAAGQLAYVTAMPVHLWLPAHFPHEAPILRPMASSFHPNVSMEWIHLTPAWGPNNSLADVVSSVGELLAYQSYDPNAVVNGVAMSWVYANLALLPTDPGDFSADAGGEPLARIARLGMAAIEEHRRKVEAMFDRLVSAKPPTEQEVVQFSWRERLFLAMFGDPDIPETIRRAAGEIEEMVLSMQGPSPVWTQIARQVSSAEAAGAAVGKVADAEEALLQALGKFDAFEKERLVLSKSEGDQAPKSIAPLLSLSLLPGLSAIQPLALELRRVVREAEQAVAELRNRLGQIAPPPRVSGILPGGMLARRLEREAAHASAAAEPARASGAVLASVEPVLDQARRESEAVNRIAAWAEYADLMQRGDERVHQLTGADPARLHAFFATAGATESGPHEYEQPMDWTGRTLAVSNPRGASLRVFDVDTEEVIASGEGAVTLPVRPVSSAQRGIAGAATSAVVVRPGERTEELRVQIEFLLTQTREALARLIPERKEPVEDEEPPTSSWAGRLAAAMNAEEAHRPIAEEHRRASQRWKVLLSDLAALGRFKHRVATHHLLGRLIEFVPLAHARAEIARQLLARSEGRLADIAARSARDFETGQLVIPQHLAGEYAEQLAHRDRAQVEIAWAAKAIQGAAERAKLRLAKPRLLGSAERPALRILARMPDWLNDLGTQVTDGATEAQVSKLEKMLGMPLRATGSFGKDLPPAHSGKI